MSYAKVYLRKTFQNWYSTTVYAREILKIFPNFVIVHQICQSFGNLGAVDRY